MNGKTLLVDPLAAFFRPTLKGRAPLTLDASHVEVTLLPPLAHVVVVRHFTNATDHLVEAVLTLPPLAPQEVVYRLVVCFGGRLYEAIPQPGEPARRAHDAAIFEGRVAILCELLENGVQLISIAGIEPGAQVEVQIWSIRPLARPDADRATLSIMLGAGPDFPHCGLSDADTPVTTAAFRSGTLAVNAAETLQLALHPRNDRPRAITSPVPVIIDCAIPILLDIVPVAGGTLDHSEWRVGEAGGWEATSARGIETFRHPMNPRGPVIGNRSDWIFGVVETADGEIRVTAPLPTEGTAPNARALRAFAAAGFAEAATPRDADAVRRMANILSRQASLAFIGPEGAIPGELPMLRKLALPEMPAPENIGAPPRPAVEPPPDRGATPRDGPLPPPYDGKLIAPGARPPRHRWLTWAPAAIALLWVASAFRFIDVPLPPMLIAFVGLMLLSAIRFLPREGSPARRRLPFLALLPLPWIASLLAGPLLGDFTDGGAPPTAGWMIPVQYGLLAASAVFPFVLMSIMRDARRFTLALGILNVALTFFATSASILVLAPGS